MSVNYASGLSPYEHKGKCGMKEISDSQDVVERAIEQLTQMIRESTGLVVITGAGISTSAGIPDFRGPNGVWTLEEKGETPKVDVTFETAKPTPTHMALVSLEKNGKLKHLISQNVDGLHVRSGFPLVRLSEIHGNMFVEECDLCKTQYVRSTVVPTMARKYTGSICKVKKQRGICRGRMRDTILDWEDELPKNELIKSEEFCRHSDLCLCLGTSLQILPCGSMPLLTKKNKGRVVVVNLQKTRLDGKCDLKIHARVDDVMVAVCKKLEIEIPHWSKPTIILQSSEDDNEHATKNKKKLPKKVLVDELLMCSAEVNNVRNEHNNNEDDEMIKEGSITEEENKLEREKLVRGSQNNEVNLNGESCNVEIDEKLLTRNKRRKKTTGYRTHKISRTVEKILF